MCIAIVGAGGIGGYFGGRLAVAGEEVVFIARGEHLRAMLRHGLRVESVDGDFLVAPCQATDDPAAPGEVDVVLAGVKAWQVPEAAREMRPLVGPETTVLPLQNGVEAPRQLAGVLGEERVVGGLCRVIVERVGPQHPPSRRRALHRPRRARQPAQPARRAAKSRPSSAPASRSRSPTTSRSRCGRSFF